MRRQSTAALVTIVLFVMALAQLGAKPAGAADDPRNAATWYRRAFERVEAITDEDINVITEYRNNPNAAPTAEIRAVIAKAQAALAAAHRGSAQGYCDYGLDFSQGYELMLPHLAPARKLARLMEAEALVRVHDGDGRGAAELVASMYRIADHCAQDGTAISSLVGRAIFKLSEEAVVVGFDRAGFSGEEAEIMLRAAREMDPNDPFDMVEAIVGEQELVVPWMRERWAAEEDGQNIAEMLGFPADDARITGLVAMDDEAFAEEIDRYDGYMDEVVAAFMLEDTDAGKAQLDRLRDELERGEHGLIAHLVTPSLNKLHEVLIESRRELAARLAMLEGLAQGEVRPEELANAAVYYAAAIERLAELDREQIERARLVVASGAEIDDALRGELIAAESAIATAREGSRLARCDFSVLGSRELELCPGHVAGMHDLLRVLHADAVRLLASGANDDAVDRLTIIFRAVGHMSGDEPILSSLVAHTAFDRAVTRIDAGFEASDLSPHHRELLRDALAHVPRKDPFGWVGSLTAGRDALLRGRVAAEADGPERVAQREAIGTATLAEIFYMHAVIDAAGRRLARDWHAPAPADPIRSLADIVSLDALDAIDALRATAPEAPKVPEFATFGEHASRARRDLRRATALLRVEVESEEPQKTD